MSLLSTLRQRLSPVPVERATPWMWDILNFNGVSYPLGLNQTLPGSREERLDGTFRSFASAYQTNGIVFAVMFARMRLFTEATFKFRRMTGGKPGDLFGTPQLAPLEAPWPNGTTGDLLARMIQDADLAGNAFVVRRAGGCAILRPDWVWIVTDRPLEDMDARVVGYEYQPGGPGGGREPIRLLAAEVAHFMPVPDPVARFRGMSWLTPIVREIMADGAASSHKLAFFENGATPNLVIKRPDEVGKDAFGEWVRLMEAGHAGAANAYKTLYLSAGADATVVGANLRQLDFKATQGAGETRIAAAGGVPPIIVGLSEGLAAATYSNYGQARRAFSDGTMRPLWRNAAGSLASIITVPGGAELWYDDRNIPFLAEDQRDIAEIQGRKATTLNALITAGYKPDAAVAAVEADDLSLLSGEHTGLYSVQLQPAGTLTPEPVMPDTTPADQAGKQAGRDLVLESFAVTREAIVAIREQPAPVNNVYITTPDVRTEFTLPEPPAPVVTVAAPEITVLPSPVEVRNQVTVEPTPVSITNAASEVTVNVEPTPVAITNEVRAGDVTVNTPDAIRIVAMPKRRTTRTVTDRTPEGIARVEDVEIDA